jgi:hypothetical protein
MNITVLIDSIVRQVTVLIAQLATAGGVRAPVAHLANQVFVQLARELESQGVSRKVSADMFGMALRAYVRKVRRLSEAESEPGITLWQAVLEFIRAQNMVPRSRDAKAMPAAKSSALITPVTVDFAVAPRRRSQTPSKARATVPPICP